MDSLAKLAPKESVQQQIGYGVAIRWTLLLKQPPRGQPIEPAQSH